MVFFVVFFFTGIDPVPLSTAIGMAVEANSSYLRECIDKAQLQELNAELFGSYIIQRDEYEFLEELKTGNTPRNEIVQKVASAVEKYIKSSPSNLTVFIQSTRRFESLHGAAK